METPYPRTWRSAGGRKLIRSLLVAKNSWRSPSSLESSDQRVHERIRSVAKSSWQKLSALDRSGWLPLGKQIGTEKSDICRDRPAYIPESQDVGDVREDVGSYRRSASPPFEIGYIHWPSLRLFARCVRRASASMYRGRLSTVVLADDSSRVRSVFLGASLQ